MNVQITTVEIIELVKRKYMDNPAVLAVADSLVTAQQMVQIHTSSVMRFDTLEGYEKGALGKEGFSPLESIHAGLFDNQFKRASAIAEVGILMRTLVIVLQRLGEPIEY